MKDAALRQLFDEMRKETAEGLAETRQVLRAEFNGGLAEMSEALRREFKDGLAETRRYVDELFAKGQRANEAAHADTRHLFTVMAENLRDEIRAIAESISLVDERTRRPGAELREETAALSGTQTVMQVEHTKLERRVSALERRRK